VPENDGFPFAANSAERPFDRAVLNSILHGSTPLLGAYLRLKNVLPIVGSGKRRAFAKENRRRGP
jgi:hypothetical protein